MLTVDYNRLGLKPGERLLDLGCGFGRHAYEPPDAAILLSVPGIGTKVAATLLAEGGDAVQRRDYAALRCLCGVAPVTRRSGKSLIVTRRLAADGRLRDATYHWARTARATRSG